MSKKYTVKAPNLESRNDLKDVVLTRHGVELVKGVGHTNDPMKARKAMQAGYDVSPDPTGAAEDIINEAKARRNKSAAPTVKTVEALPMAVAEELGVDTAAKPADVVKAIKAGKAEVPAAVKDALGVAADVTTAVVVKAIKSLVVKAPAEDGQK